MRRHAVFFALSLLAVSVAMAQPQEPDTTAPYRATELLGKEVRNPDGERLGQVREIVIEASGRVRYLIVAYGGFLHMGDRLTAVPWDMARPAAGKDYMVLAMNRETLMEAPTLDTEAWQRGDKRWMARVERYYRQRRATVGVVDFASLDVNADGLLTPAEADALGPLRDRFRIYDQDGDGVLSRSEFSAFEARESKRPTR
ncbi:MAG: PRC-barrel domain-containing protein [Gammaproteobacteria bacterium]|nr:PRC-barrel domain-containing protein [Gammaproteobacteria bacterium]